MRALPLVGTLALAAAAAAEPQASATDVRAICDAVAPDAANRGEALAGPYTMTLPASAFRLLAFDAARGRAGIDAARGFRGAGFELSLHGLTGGRAPAGALDLAFPATAAEARDLAAAHQAGRLTLVLVFQPAAADGGPACAALHTVDSDGVRLAIEPLAFE